QAARSKWVRDEIHYFLQLNRPVLPIVFGDYEYLPLELEHIQALREEPNASRPSAYASDQITNFFRRLGGSVADRPLIPKSTFEPEANVTARELNEGKLILVGRGAVGKTSLVRRLIDDEFDARESKTEGIKIDVWRQP